MIRKVLTTLFKPKPTLQAALNKHFFAEQQKQNP